MNFQFYSEVLFFSAFAGFSAVLQTLPPATVIIFTSDSFQGSEAGLTHTKVKVQEILKMKMKKKRRPNKRKVNNEEFACQEDSFSDVRVICEPPHFASAAESGRKKSTQKTDAEPVAFTGQQISNSSDEPDSETDSVIEDSAAVDEVSDGFVFVDHTGDHEFEEKTIEINPDLNFQEKK